MPTLNEILSQDITREIEGVVKADDNRRIEQDIREYVITSEVEKLLLKLFEGYGEAIQRGVQKTGDTYPYNGVWISGYFGSGKSHLLKILAYLMSSKADPELRTAFLDKIGDSWLRTAVETAFRTPATSVLFNIDQQADAETEDRSQIILIVFEKMFNRSIGYCDDDAVVADFERDIDIRGEYEEFKEKFASVTGSRWEERRDAVMTIDRELFTEAWAAFKQVETHEASLLLDRYEANRSLTAEKLAKRIREWLDRQPDTAQRINFFVDEIGQFVANRRDRMLNLQTVAETLATVCDNRAWVFVTSQEDLDSVIGDAAQVQRNDFSRITARFHFRLSLTSANVEEVIRKRLLEKNEAGRKALGEYYAGESDHLRTVFQFGKGAKDMHFSDSDHFISSYPFAAYQYYYLQQALRGLSDHNAFTGRHVSRGERSMLEVFQDVGTQLADAPLFRFATFDQMFDGIRNTLQGGIISQINLAEQQIQNPLAISLIKTLLMLKYVKDFTSNLEHLVTLMIDSPELDRSSLREDVQKALDFLEYQSYIQRNGEEYEYLTDREKDIEVEIKHTDIDYGDIRRGIGQVVVEKILKGHKLTYEANEHPYSFSVYIDDELYRSGKSDLAVRIISHLNPHFGDLQTLLNQGMGKKELLVVLDADQRTDSELRLFYQTKTYLNHSGHTEDPLHRRILNDKQLQNSERERRVREELIPSLVETAGLYVADRPLDIPVKEPRGRLLEAFQQLVSVSFPNLRLLRDKYGESSLQKFLLPSDGQALFSGDAVGMGEDEAELQAFLQRQQADAKHSSIAGIKEHFSRGQYGWYEWAILGVLAKLYAREAVEMVEGSQILDAREVLSRLTKAHGHELVTVRLAQPIDGTMLNTIASFYQDFFHKPATAATGKELIIELKKGLLAEHKSLHELYLQASGYPFLKPLGEISEKYSRLASMEYRALADTIIEEQEELLMEKLETVDPAVRFFNASGLQNYDRIKRYLQGGGDNFTVLGLSDELEELEAYLQNPRPWAGNATKKALDTYTRATGEITQNIDGEREKAEDARSEAIETIRAVEEFEGLEDGQKDEVLGALGSQLESRIRGTNSVSALQHIRSILIPSLLKECRQKIQKLAHPEKKLVYASEGEKDPGFEKSELVDREDVERYTETLKRRYLALIDEGKRIGL